MAKSKAKKSHPLHHHLEKPVHNLVGYGVLLALSVVTLFVVMALVQH